MLPGITVQAAYVGARGNHLLRRFESNLNPFPDVRPDGSLYFPAGRGPRNPAFSSIDRTTTDGQSFYNSLRLTVSRSPWKGLSVNANYTYSKSIDDTSTVFSALTHYPIDRLLNRAHSDFDLRHRLSLRYFYNFPWGVGRQWLHSGWWSNWLGGWRLGGIFSIRTGTAFDPVYGITNPGFLLVSKRPNLAPGHDNNPVKGVSVGCRGISAGQKLGGPGRYFDPCSFEPPEPGTIGNAARNSIFAPRVVNLDLSVQKDFLLDSKRRIQFRAEFFNLPNRTNFGRPNATIFADSQGRFNPSVGKLTSTSTNSRQIQFALKLIF